ncbi:hypothetical protein CPB85DRAFT_1438208 [Mucidula mucida]|nr:hypothetical protein CPB85DRAFT_1438208 [Mucidula mucida]
MVRKNPRKPGRVPWVHGTKKTFFASLKDDWKEAYDAGITVVFGSCAAIKYKIRYGDLPLQDDLEDVPSIPTSDEVAAWEAAEAQALGAMEPEAAAARQDMFTRFVTKVLTWYRLEYLGVRKKDNNPLTSALRGALKKKERPRKPKQIHVYTNVYWERHKSLVTAAINTAIADDAAKCAASLSTRQAAINAGIDPPPVRAPLSGKELKQMKLAVQRCVVKAEFDKEGDVVKKHIAELVEAKHKEDMEEFLRAPDNDDKEEEGDEEDDALETPVPKSAPPAAKRSKTALDYQLDMQQAASVLDDAATLLFKECGIVCSILMAAPLAEDGGYVGIRAIHKGTTLNTGAKWPDAEKVVYGEAEKSLIWFADKYYTDEQRAARSLSGILAPRTEPPTTSPAPTSLHATAPPPTSVRATTSPPPPTSTPVICNPELIGPELQAALDKLVDDDRRKVMRRLSRLSDYEVTRESNIVRNNAVGRALGLGQTLKASTLLTGWRKKSDEPLSDDESDLAMHLATKEEHMLEAELLRIEAEEAAMLSASDNDTAANDKDDDADADDTNDTMTQGINQTEDPVPKPHKSKRKHTEDTEEPTDSDVEEYKLGTLDWDDVDMRGWWPELTKLFGALCRGKDWSNPTWARVVDAFLIFEKRSKFIDDAKASFGTAALCPAVIATFMKNHRNYSKMWPVKTNLDDYGKGWWMWWKSAQPPSCLDNEALLKPELVEWGGLETKSGRNGFALVLASLLWWGEDVYAAVSTATLSDEDNTPSDEAVLALATASRQRADWKAAVADVAWTLEHIVRTASFKHATRPPPSKKAPPPKKLSASFVNALIAITFSSIASLSLRSSIHALKIPTALDTSSSLSRCVIHLGVFGSNLSFAGFVGEVVDDILGLRLLRELRKTQFFGQLLLLLTEPADMAVFATAEAKSSSTCIVNVHWPAGSSIGNAGGISFHLRGLGQGLHAGPLARCLPSPQLITLNNLCLPIFVFHRQPVSAAIDLVDDLLIDIGLEKAYNICVILRVFRLSEQNLELLEEILSNVLPLAQLLNLILHISRKVGIHKLLLQMLLKLCPGDFPFLF